MRPSTSTARRALRIAPVCQNAPKRFLCSSPVCQAVRGPSPATRRAGAVAASKARSAYSQSDTETALNENITGVKAVLKDAYKSKALSTEPDHAIQLIRTFCRHPKTPGYEAAFAQEMNLEPATLTMLGLILEKSRVPQLNVLGGRFLLCSANLGHLPAISRLLTTALHLGGGRLNSPALLPSMTRLKWYANAQNAEAMVLYGRILKAQNKLDEALEMFKGAAEADSDPAAGGAQIGEDAATALVNQGLIYLRRNKPAEAKPCFERAALEGDSAIAYHHLALCLDEGSVLRKTYLEKAAASGVPGAARDLAKEYVSWSETEGLVADEKREMLNWAKQWADVGVFMEDEGTKEVLDTVVDAQAALDPPKTESAM